MGVALLEPDVNTSLDTSRMLYQNDTGFLKWNLLPWNSIIQNLIASLTIFLKKNRTASCHVSPITCIARQRRIMLVGQLSQL